MRKEIRDKHFASRLAVVPLNLFLMHLNRVSKLAYAIVTTPPGMACDALKAQMHLKQQTLHLFTCSRSRAPDCFFAFTEAGRNVTTDLPADAR